MIRITDESDFWMYGEPAEEIFRYRQENPDVKDAPWGFDRGSVDREGSSAYAVFSHVAVSGWGNDTLYINARRETDGSWVVSHSIERAN